MRLSLNVTTSKAHNKSLQPDRLPVVFLWLPLRSMMPQKKLRVNGS